MRDVDEPHASLPDGYQLDRSDPDVWILYKAGRLMLEAFWPEVATPDNLRLAIEAHRRAQQGIDTEPAPSSHRSPRPS
jgi:hypothetical protein